MPVMSNVERAVCTSAPWRGFAGRVVLPWVLDGTTPTGEVLEIGGGAGAMVETIVARQPGVACTLTDLDPAMLGAASRRLGRSGGRVQIAAADATRLPFADASFDLVLSFVMLHHVTDWPAAVAEVRRVLRPGGRFVGVDLTRTRLTGGFHRSRTGRIAMATAGELEAGFHQAGFAAPSIRPGLAGAVVRFDAVR